MATVTGLTSARMLEIENASVVNGYIDELGHLMLVTKGGTLLDAGPITSFYATEDAAGGVELATAAETLAGIDNQRAVTPAGLASVIGGFQGYRYKERLLFTASSSFVKANYSGLKAIRVQVIGGGGGGGGAPMPSTGNHSSGGGGGGGGSAEKFILAAALADTETVTVGAGGSFGLATHGAVAGTGGTSSFGTHVSATGGLGGVCTGNVDLALIALGGTGGGSSGGDLLMTGGSGHAGGGHLTIAHGGAGGSSIRGGGGGGVYTPAGGGSSNGFPGRVYGGGGSGAAVNAEGAARNGGVGAQGLVVVEVYV